MISLVSLDGESDPLLQMLSICDTFQTVAEILVQAEAGEFLGDNHVKSDLPCKYVQWYLM